MEAPIKAGALIAWLKVIGIIGTAIDALLVAWLIWDVLGSSLSIKVSWNNFILIAASIVLSVLGLGCISKLLNYQKTFQQVVIATGLALGSGRLEKLIW